MSHSWTRLSCLSTPAPAKKFVLSVPLIPCGIFDHSLQAATTSTASTDTVPRPSRCLDKGARYLGKIILPSDKGESTLLTGGAAGTNHTPKLVHRASDSRKVDHDTMEILTGRTTPRCVSLFYLGGPTHDLLCPCRHSELCCWCYSKDRV